MTNDLHMAEIIAEIEQLKIEADEDAQKVADSFDIYDEEEAERLFNILSSSFRIDAISESVDKRSQAIIESQRREIQSLRNVIKACFVALPYDQAVQLVPLIRAFKEDEEKEASA